MTATGTGGKGAIKLENTKMKINPVSKNVWEIPAAEKNGMNVPARIYATESLLHGMDSGVFEQITNVACLPGIVKNAIACPDSHWGYGFPVGGVAAFDPEEGIISPGGIGFDINCVAGDTRILTKHGYWKKISEFGSGSQDEVAFMDLDSKERKASAPLLIMKKREYGGMLKIITEQGNEIILTKDHPLYNGKEMIEAGKIKESDRIASLPFEGVEYEEPQSKTIIDETDITKIIGDRWKLFAKLKEKNLLPLKQDSLALPTLAKLVGFITGDGWIGKYYSKKRKQEVWSTKVSGRAEDLREIAEDFKKLGFESNYFRSDQCNSTITMTNGNKGKIRGKSTTFCINSQAMSVLLHALGVPFGNKTKTKTFVPEWVKESPRWIKRLYLAGLFGAELTKPAQRKGEKYRFLEPNFSQNKINRLKNDNLNFMLDIIKLLGEFRVEVNNIHVQEGIINTAGEKTHKIAIRLSSKEENLIMLWGRIGYEYCAERKRKSMLALAYLKKKRHHLNKVNAFIENASQLIKENKATKHAVLSSAKEFGYGKAMVACQLAKRTESLRIGRAFQAFEEFAKSNAIGNSGFVLDKAEKIETIQEFNGHVYDFTMNDPNHNFIANGIVSHNCGMRLISTNLNFREVKPKIHELVNNLFEKVPAGVGVKGTISLKRNQVVDVLHNGAKWCLENGYAWKEDIERIEGRGCIEGADSRNVSERAIGRSMNQLGTLGSGNHYLEVQVIQPENIYNLEIAEKFGVRDNEQVMVMVHCGSRGTGHQIATDYLKEFGPVMEKYKIKVPERDLACAPFASEEGQRYYSAMACAANNAFANRQIITHNIRKVFEKVFRKKAEDMEMNLIYDVAHNIAKVEKHKVDGKIKKLVVHRKGSTRCFGPGHEELAPLYRKTGQPVIVGGSMETGSYVCVGTEKAMLETFGSTMHGSGRTMSRTKAKGLVNGEELQKEMESRGIYVKSASYAGLAEEAGMAYKDISEVIATMDEIGISKKVFSLKPVGNVKG
ncbi:tRNA-splicing ligase RtcB [uncultured archaeon]|nr:tRNA-splicing ligase RtcB [uncultured archaeon]